MGLVKEIIGRFCGRVSDPRAPCNHFITSRRSVPIIRICCHRSVLCTLHISPSVTQSDYNGRRNRQLHVHRRATQRILGRWQAPHDQPAAAAGHVQDCHRDDAGWYAKSKSTNPTCSDCTTLGYFYTTCLLAEVIRCIKDMTVRGAPAIGAAGAFGMALHANSTSAADAYVANYAVQRMHRSLVVPYQIYLLAALLCWR
jgi:hypothetical protein